MRGQAGEEQQGSIDRSLEVDAGCRELGLAPVLGPIHSVGPVLGGGLVDRLWIPAMLPEAVLVVLELIRIIGFDGPFHDHRRLLYGPVVAVGRPVVSVRGGRGGDFLPDLRQRHLVHVRG